jgi:hypothetical protein
VIPRTTAASVATHFLKNITDQPSKQKRPRHYPLLQT